MDIYNQFDSLHLSEPVKKRRRSDLFVPPPPSVIENELVENQNDIEVPVKEEEENRVRKSTRRKSIPVRWNPANVVEEQTNSSQKDSQFNVEKYYLDKTVKKTNTPLETIFEDMNDNKKKAVMSGRKFKRCINFKEIHQVNPGKIKKRKLKAAKTSGKKRLSIKLTIEDLYEKLSSIEDS